MARRSLAAHESLEDVADIGQHLGLSRGCDVVPQGRRRVRRRRAWNSPRPMCAQLGKWVHFDVMRNELTFLHVRKQHKHTFEHTWNLFTTEGHSSATSTSTERRDCTSTVTDKPAGADTPAQSAGRDTKRTAKKQHPDEDEWAKAKMVTAKATPRPSPKEAKAMPQHQAARGVRTRYHEAAGCSATLISAVERDPAWRWANTEHMLGDLKKHVKTMNDVVDVNTRLFLIGMPNDDLAKLVSDNHAFETTIKTVENELGSAVDRVFTQCARKTNAHVVLANG